MQDWLNERKLDRKALSVLAANEAAAQAYQEHAADAAAALLQARISIPRPCTSIDGQTHGAICAL